LKTDGPFSAVWEGH